MSITEMPKKHIAPKPGSPEHTAELLDFLEREQNRLAQQMDILRQTAVKLQMAEAGAGEKMVRNRPKDGPFRYLGIGDPIDAIESYLICNGPASPQEIIDELIDGAAITDKSYEQASGDIKRSIAYGLRQPTKGKKGQPRDLPRLAEKGGKIVLGPGAHLKGK